MKEIHVTTITEAVAGLAVEACCRLPEDMVEAMRAARALEPSPVGRNILDQILENAAIAARETMPICQDTGLTVVFAEVGQDVRIVGGGFEDAVNEGVRRGYVDGYLRKSCVAEPLFERKNTRDNTPAVIHTRIVPGDSLRLRLAPKGAGWCWTRCWPPVPIPVRPWWWAWAWAAPWKWRPSALRKPPRAIWKASTRTRATRPLNGNCWK